MGGVTEPSTKPLRALWLPMDTHESADGGDVYGVATRWEVKCPAADETAGISNNARQRIYDRRFNIRAAAA